LGNVSPGFGMLGQVMVGYDRLGHIGPSFARLDILEHVRPVRSQ